MVAETYGRPYSFQQQDGCKGRGVFHFNVPSKYGYNDYKNDSIPEAVDGRKMGVSFKAWLERDPSQKLSNPEDQHEWSYANVDTISTFENTVMIDLKLYKK